jgi:hypothetical protein
VAEQHDPLVGKLLVDMFVNDVRVVDDEIPAVPLGEKHGLGIGAAVAAVVMSTNDDSAPIRYPGETVVAIDMFAHSVKDLHDTDDVSVRAPYAQPDLVISLCGQ